MELISKGATDAQVQALTSDDKLRAASAAAESAKHLKITDEVSAESWAGDRAKIKAGIKTIEDGLTAMFRPLKSFERDLRARFAPMRDQLAAVVEAKDRELLAWQREERLRAERVRAEQEAAAKAAAAAAKDEQEVFGEDAPPPPQIAAPAVATSTVRGAAGSTWTTTRLDAELVDVLEVAKNWPHLLLLDVPAAKRAFAAMRDRGQVDAPGEGGKVIGGIKFVTVTTVAGGRR